MKLPKELTTVTRLSKLVAMILFVALPIVGFLLGIRHQQIIDSPTVIATYPTPTINETANWQTYRDDEFGFEIKYPEGWTTLEHSSQSVEFHHPNNNPYISLVVSENIGESNDLHTGIIFCGAYPDQCTTKKLSIGGVQTTIEWRLHDASVNFGIPGKNYTIGISFNSNFEKTSSEEMKLFLQILSTFRFVEDGSVFKGVPTTYEQCAKTEKNYLLGSTDLECKYSVSYSDNDETNKDKYLECQKIGGITTSLHGDTFDSNNPPVYTYMCDLNFYNPHYQFPRTFEECRDSKAEWLRASIDSQGRCNIAIENITHFNKDIANNLMDKCIVLGGSYTEYPNPRFARTQCVIWFDKK